MKPITSWDDCKQKYVRKIKPDILKAESMYTLIQVRKQALTGVTIAFLKLEAYYEIIKELTSLLMLLDGLKSSNHECIVSYFTILYPELEYESERIHELKNIRNNIQYEGKIPREEYLEKTELEFKHIIELLEKDVLKKLCIS